MTYPEVLIKWTSILIAVTLGMLLASGALYILVSVLVKVIQMAGGIC